MAQRIAITVAGVVATIILAFGLVAVGFGPRSAPGSMNPTAEIVADPLVAASAPSEIETVYVVPAPAPRTVVQRRQQTSSRVSSSTSRRSREVRYDRGDEDRYERKDREDDDDHDDHDDREDREDREDDHEDREDDD